MELPHLVPDHVCGDDCDLPAGVLFAAALPQIEGFDNLNFAEATTQIHKFSADMVAELLVTLFTEAMLDEESDMPLVVQFGFAREALRRAVESTKPPASVQEQIDRMGATGEL